jgi:uncharacterized protein (TIGR02246 family)
MPKEEFKPKSADETAVYNLYKQLLKHWNDRDAVAYASFFAENSNVTGFDGSQMNGREEIRSSLHKIFDSHMTNPYVSKIRDISSVCDHTVILRAVVGMVPRGKSDIKPDVNAIQSLVAAKTDGKWSIVLFQNTPAQFHGRPDLAKDLTEELRELIQVGAEAK